MGVFSNIKLGDEATKEPTPKEAPVASSTPKIKPSSLFGGVGTSTPKTTPKTGGVFSNLDVKPEPIKTPYFAAVDSGGSYGFSPTETDVSGRAFFAYRNPGDTATTTDKTRVATKFDPRVPSKVTRDSFYNPRAEGLRQQFKDEMGIAYNEELDHRIALALSGSNDRANLEPVTNNEDSAIITDLQRRVINGEMSLFDAQVSLAKKKGFDKPFTGKKPGFFEKLARGTYKAINPIVEKLFPSKTTEEATEVPTSLFGNIPSTPNPVEQLEQFKGQELRQTPSSKTADLINKIVPEKVRVIAKDIKEGVVGRGLGVDMAGNLHEDRGAFGILPGFSKTDFAKAIQRADALEEAGVTPERANQIALLFVNNADKLKKLENKKNLATLNLSEAEEKVLSKIGFFEGVNNALDALNFISAGTLGVGKTAAIKIANSVDRKFIAKILKEEIPTLSNSHADAFASVLTDVKNADDVQKIINRTSYQLQGAGKATGNPVTKSDQLKIGDEVKIVDNKTGEVRVGVVDRLAPSKVGRTVVDGKITESEIPDGIIATLDKPYLFSAKSFFKDNTITTHSLTPTERAAVEKTKSESQAAKKKMAEMPIETPTKEGGLLAVHNLNERKLLFSDKIGGLANPSLAVLDPKLTSFESYGDISLVGNKELIAGQKTHLADAYTPRFPSVHSRLSWDDFKRLDSDMKPFYDQIGADAKKIYHDDSDMIRYIENNPAVALKFLKEKGIEPTSEGQHYYNSQINKAGLDTEYQSFLDDIYKKYNLKEEMFQGHTYSGQRRYRPVTVEGASKYMSKQKDEGFNYGLGSFRSKLAPIKKTAEGIVKEKGRLVTKDQFEIIRDAHDKELWSLKDKLEPYARITDSSNRFIESDHQLNSIGAVLKGEKDAWRYFDQKFPTAPAELKTEILKFREKLRKMPTEYFETKFKRPVGLREFKIAVVPDTISARAEEILRKNGLQIIKYKKGEKAQALQSITKESGVAFKRATQYRSPFRGPKIETSKVAELLKGIVPPDKIKYVFDPRLLKDEKALGMFRQNPRMEMLNPALKPVIDLYMTGGKVYVRTAFHEAYHYLENKVFSKEFVDQLNKETLAKMTNRDHGNYDDPRYNTPEKRASEYRADEFAKVETKKAGYQSPIMKVIGMVRAALRKIVAAVKEMAQKFHSNQKGAINFFSDMHEESLIAGDRLRIKSRNGKDEYFYKNSKGDFVQAENRKEAIKLAIGPEDVVPKEAVRTKPVVKEIPKKEPEPTEIRPSFKETLKGELERNKIEHRERAKKLLEFQKSEIKNNPTLVEKTQEVDLLEDLVDNHPARGLAKFANKQTDELPEVLGEGKSKFGRKGDDIVTESGYADSEQARDSYQDYRRYQQDLIRAKNELQALKTSAREDLAALADETRLEKISEKNAKETEKLLSQEDYKKQVAKAADTAEKNLKAEALKKSTLQEKINKARAEEQTRKSFWGKIKQSLFPTKSLDVKTQEIIADWYRNKAEAPVKAQQTFVEMRGKGPQTFQEITEYQAGKGTPYIREKLDSLGTEAKREGLGFEWQENYLPQVYRQTGPTIMDAIRRRMLAQGMKEAEIKAYLAGAELTKEQSLRLKLRPNFVKERFFPDYKTAMKYGLSPKYTTPAQLIAYYDESLSMAVANKKFINTLKSEAKLLGEEDRPDSWEPVTTRFSREQLYAPPSLADFLNGIYRNEEALNPFQMVVRGTAKYAKASWNLVTSTGVPMSNINSFGYGLGLMKNITAGIGALPEGIIRVVGTGDPAAMKMSLTAFKQSLNYFRSNSTKYSRAFMAEHIGDLANMAKQNIALSADRSSYTKIENTFKKIYRDLKEDLSFAGDRFKEGTKAKGISQIGRAGMDATKSTWSKLFSEKTFDMINQQTVIVFSDTYKEMIRRGYDEVEAGKFAGEVTRNWMGLMDIPESGRSAGMLDAINATAGAPQYREGILNVLWNSVKGTMDFKNPAYTLNRGLIVGAAMTYVLYDQLNYHNVGHHLWENPPGREFALGIKLPDGNVAYLDILPSVLTVPRNLGSAAIALAHGDIKTATHKVGTLFSIPIQLVTNIFTNKDYFGRPIYDDADTATTKAKKISIYAIGQSGGNAYFTEPYKYFSGEQPLYETAARMLEAPVKFSSARTEEWNNVQLIYNSNQKLKANGDSKQADEIYGKLTASQKKTYDILKSQAKRVSTVQRRPAIQRIYNANRELTQDQRDEIYGKLSRDDQRIYDSIKKAAESK